MYNLLSLLIFNSELQKLADQEDSEAESSDDDWKQEGRKISEEITKGKMNFRRPAHY